MCLGGLVLRLGMTLRAGALGSRALSCKTPKRMALGDLLLGPFLLVYFVSTLDPQERKLLLGLMAPVTLEPTLNRALGMGDDAWVAGALGDNAL